MNCRPSENMLKAFLILAPNEDARSAIAAANARLIADAEDHEFEALIVERIDLLEELEDLLEELEE